MPTLYLFRHAKSDWSDDSLDDHDRPLAPRGRRAAPAMADFMASEGLEPRTVLCSGAVRTRQTWQLMADRIGSGATVIYEEELYGASRREILRTLGRLGDDAGPAMVIGHNPGIGATAVALAGSGDEDARRRMARNFPTAALAVLTAPDRGWDELETGCCRLDLFVMPKDLPEATDRRL